MSTTAAILEENRRLAEIVHRQDEAIDCALEAMAHLAKTGSMSRVMRETARQALIEARNERLKVVVPRV